MNKQIAQCNFLEKLTQHETLGVIQACTQGNGTLLHVVLRIPLGNFDYTIKATSHPIHKYRYANNIMPSEKSRPSMQQYMYGYVKMHINYISLRNLSEYHVQHRQNITYISFWEKPLTLTSPLRLSRYSCPDLEMQEQIIS